MAADAELCVVLKRSRYLKLAQVTGPGALQTTKNILSGGLRIGGKALLTAAPAATAATATGALTDWDPNAMTGAAAVTLPFQAGGALAKAHTRSSAAAAETAAAKARDALVTQRTNAAKPVTPFVPEPVPARPDFMNPATISDPALRQRVEEFHAAQAGGPARFDPAALKGTPLEAQYAAHVKAVTDADAALKARPAFAPKPFAPAGERAPLPPRAVPAQGTPEYQAAETAYHNARQADLVALKDLAAKEGFSSVDDLLATAQTKGFTGQALFKKIEAEMQGVNKRFGKQAPAPAEDLFQRVKQPFATWEQRAVNAKGELPAALQAREQRDIQKVTDWQTRAKADELAQRQAYDQDPAFLAAQQAHQDALIKQQNFEQSNIPKQMTPQELAQKRQALQLEVDTAHQNAVNANMAANKAGTKTEADAIAEQARLKAGLPASVQASNKARQTAQGERALATGTAIGAPVAAAAAGTTAGLTHAGRAIGDAINSGAAALKPDGKPDYVQLAKDYLPAVAGIGAVAALAYLLLSDDDEEDTRKTAMESLGTSSKRKLTKLLAVNPGLVAKLSTLPKMGAEAPDDHVARGARNRRRIQGLLARNPRALDNIDADGALHALPIQLDAAQKAKLAAALQAN